MSYCHQNQTIHGNENHGTNQNPTVFPIPNYAPQGAYPYKQPPMQYYPQHEHQNRMSRSGYQQAPAHNQSSGVNAAYQQNCSTNNDYTNQPTSPALRTGYHQQPPDQSQIMGHQEVQNRHQIPQGNHPIQGYEPRMASNEYQHHAYQQNFTNNHSGYSNQPPAPDLEQQPMQHPPTGYQQQPPHHYQMMGDQGDPNRQQNPQANYEPQMAGNEYQQHAPTQHPPRGVDGVYEHNHDAYQQNFTNNHSGYSNQPPAPALKHQPMQHPPTGYQQQPPHHYQMIGDQGVPIRQQNLQGSCPTQSYERQMADNGDFPTNHSGYSNQPPASAMEQQRIQPPPTGYQPQPPPQPQMMNHKESHPPQQGNFATPPFILTINAHKPPANLPANQFQEYLNHQYNLYNHELRQQENRHETDMLEKDQKIWHLEHELGNIREHLKHYEDELERLRDERISRYASAPTEESVSIQMDDSSTGVSSPIPESIEFLSVERREMTPMEDGFVVEDPDHHTAEVNMELVAPQLAEEVTSEIEKDVEIQGNATQEVIPSAIVDSSAVAGEKTIDDSIASNDTPCELEVDEKEMGSHLDIEEDNIQEPNQPVPGVTEVVILVISKALELPHIPLKNFIVKDPAYDVNFPPLNIINATRKMVSKPLKTLQKEFPKTAIPAPPRTVSGARPFFDKPLRKANWKQDNGKGAQSPGTFNQGTTQRPKSPTPKVDAYGFTIPKRTVKARQVAEAKQTWTLKSSRKSSSVNEAPHANDTLSSSSNRDSKVHELDILGNVKQETSEQENEEVPNSGKLDKKLAVTAKKKATSSNKKNKKVDNKSKRKGKQSKKEEEYKKSDNQSEEDLINLNATSVMEASGEQVIDSLNIDREKSSDIFENFLGPNTDPTEPLLPVVVAEPEKTCQIKKKKKKTKKNNSNTSVPLSLINQNYESEPGSPIELKEFPSSSSSNETAISSSKKDKDLESQLLAKVLGYAEKMHPVRHSCLALRRVYKNIDGLQDIFLNYWRNHFVYGLSTKWKTSQIAFHISKTIAKYRSRNTEEGRLMSTFFGILLLQKEQVIMEDMICMFCQNGQSWNTNCQDRIEQWYFEMINRSVNWNFENFKLSPVCVDDLWMDMKLIPDQYRAAFAEHVNSQFFMRYKVGTKNEDLVSERQIEKTVREAYNSHDSFPNNWSPEQTQNFLQAQLDNLNNSEEKTEETTLHIQLYDFLLCYPSSIIDFDAYWFWYCLDYPTPEAALKSEKEFFNLIFNL